MMPHHPTQLRRRPDGGVDRACRLGAGLHPVSPGRQLESEGGSLGELGALHRETLRDCFDTARFGNPGLDDGDRGGDQGGGGEQGKSADRAPRQSARPAPEADILADELVLGFAVDRRREFGDRVEELRIARIDALGRVRPAQVEVTGLLNERAFQRRRRSGRPGPSRSRCSHRPRSTRRRSPPAGYVRPSSWYASTRSPGLPIGSAPPRARRTK